MKDAGIFLGHENNTGIFWGIFQKINNKICWCTNTEGFFWVAKKVGIFFGQTNSEVGIFWGIKYEPLLDPPIIKICEWGPWVCSLHFTLSLHFRSLGVWSLKSEVLHRSNKAELSLMGTKATFMSYLLIKSNYEAPHCYKIIFLSAKIQAYLRLDQQKRMAAINVSTYHLQVPTSQKVKKVSLWPRLSNITSSKPFVNKEQTCDSIFPSISVAHVPKWRRRNTLARTTGKYPAVRQKKKARKACKSYFLKSRR